jgi:hypothetical protein
MPRTTRDSLSKPINSRQTVDEDYDLGAEIINNCQDNNDGDNDENNKDEYDDIVAETLNHGEDQTNLLFKNLLKKEGFGGFGSIGARESVLHTNGRYSYA